MDSKFLAQLPLFQNLPEAELQRLAATLEALEVEPGTMLFHEGDRGEHFYVVLDGELEVIQAHGTLEERLLAIRRPGDFVGELSLMNPDALRTAAVRAPGPARLWEMTRPDFERLVQRQPGFAYEMLRELGTRLTDAQSATIEDLKEKNRQLAEAYEALKAAQVQLIEKERLERELQVAREIQMSILPQVLPPLPGYEFGGLMVPARAVGGDFYDLIPLDDDRVGIVIGDVSDKGVPSALFMAQIHALIRAEADVDASPPQVLTRANRQLVEIGEPLLFATVLYGILHRATGSFAYARAGHEPPILVAKPDAPKVTAWGAGQPLGLLPAPLLDEQSVTIAPGGTLLLYTDGISDGRSPAGEDFGRDRVLSSAGSLYGAPGQAVCDGLWQRLSAFQRDAPQQDDVTLVAVHRNAV
jgi:serine phosphatase RsbU (regulator of sigma subunit)